MRLLPGKTSITALCILPGVALGHDRCPIEKAVFTETDAGTVLSFRQVDSDAAAVSHLFSITGGKLKLDGHVMYDDESERPVAMIMNSCPEGDATGAELRACTVWTGVPYAVAVTGGRVDVLGAEGSETPDAIVLPGFGPALRHSTLWHASGLARVAWDVYQFKECKP